MAAEVINPIVLKQREEIREKLAAAKEKRLLNQKLGYCFQLFCLSLPLRLLLMGGEESLCVSCTCSRWSLATIAGLSALTCQQIRLCSLVGFLQ